MVLEELRVLVVEIDLSVSASLADTVSGMGLSLVGTVRSGEEAVEMAINTQPHLILMDIQLAGDMDGIDAAREIQFRHACAVIFLSEVEHEPTLRRLNSIKYKFYLPKPITPFQLRQIIPQVVSLLGQPMLDQQLFGMPDPLGDSIFITHKSQQERIRLDEIRYLKAEHNHCKVYVNRESPPYFLASQPMGGVLDDIKTKRGGANFLRIHKSYAINLQHLSRCNGNQVVLGEDTLVVGKTYREAVFSVINPA
ncbi:MAG TPA: hypothetical protein DCE41_11835 [Cytophagales bacterium]|nr:hypothetical protein [Cytophagales bacterium]HAA18107.1 hypothetical protein [Cytophagales bacterium]HAP61885.1 hypothetical protein [Cytophagales bacterium]